MALPNTEEIIENSIFTLIQKSLIEEGYLPDVYDKTEFDWKNSDISIKRQAQQNYEAALDIIRDTKGFSIEVFNYNDSQSRGIKTVPRIVIETQGFFPGSIGKDSTAQYKLNEAGLYDKLYDGQKTSDLYMNIHLLGNSVEQIRVLHAINSQAIPRRGYIPRFESEELDMQLRKSGNIYIEYINYNEISDTQQGVIEKVYRYMIPDVVEYNLKKDNTPIHKIISIEKEINVKDVIN